jgi:pimeloyl-ACP methyl ester carboxylesterase
MEFIAAGAPGVYTTATYDRRGFSRSSTVEGGMRTLSPPQGARDALAVMRALGFERAVFFGCSLGGVLALQVAAQAPESVVHAVAMEVPTTALLDDVDVLYDWLLGVGMFMQRFRGLRGDGAGEPPQELPENWGKFLEHELVVGSTFFPNLWRVKKSGVSVGLLRCDRSRGAFYWETVEKQQEILGCPMIDAPGNHVAYHSEINKFGPVLLDFLKMLDEKKKEE